MQLCTEQLERDEREMMYGREQVARPVWHGLMVAACCVFLLAMMVAAVMP